MTTKKCQVDIENAQKNANTTLSEMKKVVDDLLDELPLEVLDDETVRNLYRGLNQAVEGAEEGLATFRFNNGIRVQRSFMNQEDANAHIVENDLVPSIETAQRSLHKLNEELRTLSSTKDVNLLRTFREGLGETIKRALPDDMVVDFIDGGETLEELVRIMGRMNHVQRLETVVRLQDEFPTQFHKITEQLADIDAKNITIERAMNTLKQLEDIEFKMNGALDLAAIKARNPYVDALELSPSYLAMTEEFSSSADRKVIADQFVNDKLQTAVKNQFGPLTESLATRLLKSEVPGAQMFALNILETPSGFAGDIIRPNTAAIRSSMLHKRSIHKVNTAYSELLDEVGAELGWGRIKRLIMQDGHAKTHPELDQINREVMIHINDLFLGKPSNASAPIQKYAKVLNDSYGEIHNNGIGKVDGITLKNKIKNYQNQRYDDHQFRQLTKDPQSKQQLTTLFHRGLVGGGMDEDIAAKVAKVVVNSKVNSMHSVSKGNQPLGEEQLSGLLPTLQEIVDGLKNNEVRPSDIQRFVDAFQGAGDDAIPSYAHRRLRLDLNAEGVVGGKNMKLVDLMEKDSSGNFDRYSKEANARIGIAEAMPALSSDAAINDYIANVGKQAQLLGTHVDTKSLRNIVNVMMGLQPEGSLPMDVRKVRDLVSLAGMGGLGESQLAETGMALNRGISGLIGAAQMLSGRQGLRKQARGIELTPEQMGDTKLMGELGEMTGLFQNAHRILRRNIHYEQHDSDFGALSKAIEFGTGGKYRNTMKAMQDRFTGYGAIRSMQDQLTMASLLQDVSKSMRGDKPFTTVKRFRDLGIDIEDPNNMFFKNIRKFADVDEKGIIRELNIHKWSQADLDEAGIILNRHAGQNVQSGFAGEMSHMMENPWVAFMMQFKSYPLLAAEKQQARQLKFADKEAATGIFLNAASSSGARIIRYASVAGAQPLGERQDYFERQLENLPFDTWAYMGVAGMTPTIGPYASQFMGHPFGLGQGGHPVEGLHTEMPALSYATKMMTAHNRVTNGEPMNDNDYARIQSLAPLGTIGFTNIMAGIFRSFLND